MASIKTRIKLRTDAISNWTSSTSLIYKGEAALGLGTDNKYVIKIGISDSGTTWANLTEDLTIPVGNVIGLSTMIYEYQLVESSTKGTYTLQKKLPSESSWTDVTSISLVTQGTYSSTNPLATKDYVDTQVGGATTQYFEGVRNNGETDAQAIARIIGGSTVKGGSTCVIKTELDGVNGFDASKTVVEGYYHNSKFYEDSEHEVEITPDTQNYYKDILTGQKYGYNGTVFTALQIAYEYIAFTYDTTTDSSKPTWRAMDGNYNAENVYFTKDILATYEIGRYKPDGSGSVNIPTKGKNVYAALDDILSKLEQGSIKTQSSASLSSVSNFKAYEVGSMTNTLSYSTTTNAGAYKYGPTDTGVTFSDFKVNFNNVQKTSTSGTFDSLRVGDTTKLTISGTYDATAGVNALTNKGTQSSPEVKIAAKNDNALGGSATITGFRYSFWGAVTSKEDITSAIIRALPNKGINALNSTTLAVGGSVRVIIAIPASKPTGAQGTYNTFNGSKMSKILDQNDSNANISGTFTKTTVQVNDANGENPINYSVYYVDFASAHATDNFIITQ